MHSPPPVRFPVGRGSQWGRVVAGVWLLALLSLLSALALHAPARAHTLALLTALVALVLGAGLAWRLWRGQVPGALVWDGAQWLLVPADKDSAAAAITPPGIRFDSQRWLLLRTRAGRRPVWLWVERSAGPHDWHALRCALYAQVSA